MVWTSHKQLHSSAPRVKLLCRTIFLILYCDGSSRRFHRTFSHEALLSYMAAYKRSSAIGEVASSLNLIITVAGHYAFLYVVIKAIKTKERFRDLAILLTALRMMGFAPGGKNTLSKLTCD